MLIMCHSMKKVRMNNEVLIIYQIQHEQSQPLKPVCYSKVSIILVCWDKIKTTLLFP